MQTDCFLKTGDIKASSKLKPCLLVVGCSIGHKVLRIKTFGTLQFSFVNEKKIHVN